MSCAYRRRERQLACKKTNTLANWCAVTIRLGRCRRHRTCLWNLVRPVTHALPHGIAVAMAHQCAVCRAAWKCAPALHGLPTDGATQIHLHLPIHVVASRPLSAAVQSLDICDGESKCLRHIWRRYMYARHYVCIMFVMCILYALCILQKGW